MNFTKALMIICILFTGACDFDFPLSTENTTPIDELGLGLWLELNEEETMDKPTFLNIMQFSDKEYLVHYYQGESSFFFRAYLIKVSDRIMLQTQVIGTEDGPVATSEEALFTVISYTIDGDELTFTQLNTELIDTEISSSAALWDAFIKQKDNPELFTHLSSFKRILVDSPVIKGG